MKKMLFLSILFLSVVHSLYAQDVGITEQRYKELDSYKKKLEDVSKEKLDLIKKYRSDSLSLKKINTYKFENKRDSLKIVKKEIEKKIKEENNKKREKDSLLTIVNNNKDRKKELTNYEKPDIIKSRIENLKNEITRKKEDTKKDSVMKENYKKINKDTTDLSNKINKILKNIKDSSSVKTKIESGKNTDTIAKLKKESPLLENKYSIEKNKNTTNKNTIDALINIETEKKDIEKKVNEATEEIRQQFPAKVNKCLQDIGEKGYNTEKVNTLLRNCGKIKEISPNIVPDITELENKLNAYKNICKAVDEYKGVLNRPYDKNAVTNAINSLDNNKANASQAILDDIEKYKKILQGYCQINRATYLINEGAKAYMPDYPEDARKVIADFLKEKEKDLKNYPYLYKEVRAKSLDGWHKIVVYQSECK